MGSLHLMRGSPAFRGQEGRDMTSHIQKNILGPRAWHRAWHTVVLNECLLTVTSQEGSAQTLYRAQLTHPGLTHPGWSSCSLHPVRGVHSGTGRGWGLWSCCHLPGAPASHMSPVRTRPQDQGHRPAQGGSQEGTYRCPQ